ncbi:Hypothetical protein, putative [Bodo saltans]|uniref:Mitochondrial RNA binding complex 1 subunit domain-containing protein n=1 Tax=Bodo saltans TaxID=75058 RepID=A0A0S4JSB1_BODSA|nr:Hypothetical protein, putative [Bodo saltans]|eukprot:CUG93088.1 Hypothetical protein, putative [Bodo saltans]
MLRGCLSTTGGAGRQLMAASMVRMCPANITLSARCCATPSQPPTDAMATMSGSVDAVAIPIRFTPGSGPGGALAAPSTAVTGHCDVLSECVTQADELTMQMKAQEATGSAGQVLTKEGMEEFMEELKSSACAEMTTLIQETKGSVMLQQAGMHELRRTLHYTTNLMERKWIDDATQYTPMMRMLTVELLRRDNDGVLSPDDVLYVSSHIIVSNFYNRQLWNRLEKSMLKFSNFELIDIASIKSLTTKLFRSRKGCAPETMDVRRKILNAMSRRVGVLANDFDIPSLLGVLQCYAAHDLLPRWIEPLAHRAANHIGDYTPHECATMGSVLRRWGLMRLEVCEKLLERIVTTDTLTHHMATNALFSVKLCYGRISEGGRNAMNAEPMKQKLRAMGEQIGARLDEVVYPALPVVLRILDVVVTMKIYVPRKCLEGIFQQANDMMGVLIEGKDELVDPKTKKRVRPITAEEARQLQALLNHYGTDLSAELSARLKQAFADGLLPDEESMF